ncbi:MAG TPA: hypothetical protein PLU39_18900, partial [Armatimonadota bacterium]|nr:hypothetical protein [Armatimonadota bacterium]
MRRAAKVGLLPFYLALYDSALPEARHTGERFVRQIVGELERLGLEVQTAPLCRVEAEFDAAVRGFEDAGVDAILTLHVAYSPSLESAPVLARTSLPIIVVDTTPEYAFGPDQSPDAIMANHGIHGVQDLCNMLLRLKRPFRVEAGHWEHSDLLHRVARWANAACLVSALRRARVGRIGRPFPGMGDFAVPPERLRATIGVETVPCEPETIRGRLDEITEEEVDAEVAGDLAACETEDLALGAHREAV